MIRNTSKSIDFCQRKRSKDRNADLDGETEKEKKEEHKLETDTEGISSKIFSLFLSLFVKSILYGIQFWSDKKTTQTWITKKEKGRFLTSACKFYSEIERKKGQAIFHDTNSDVLNLFFSLSSWIWNRLIYWFSHILLSSSLFFMILLSFNGFFILSFFCSFCLGMNLPLESLMTSLMQIKTWQNNEWNRLDMRRVEFHLNSTKQNKCKLNFNSFHFHLYHHVSCLVLHFLCFLRHFHLQGMTTQQWFQVWSVYSCFVCLVFIEKEKRKHV